MYMIKLTFIKELQVLELKISDKIEMCVLHILIMVSL